MSLRSKLIIGGCIVWTMAIGLFAIGLWATVANAKIEEPEPDVITEPVIYELPNSCDLYVDYECLDAMLDRITGVVPFMPISDDDRYVVECVVAGEAGGHSYPLMKAVAQCMAISMDMRGMSADEVRREHQYHGYKPEFEQDDPYAWTMVCSAVSEIFDDGNFVVYEPIEYFYNPSYGGGDFHEKMDFIIEIEGVRFFRDAEVG